MTATSHRSRVAFGDAISPWLDTAYKLAAQLTESPSQAEACLVEAALLGSRAQPVVEAGADIRPAFLGLMLERCRSRQETGGAPAPLTLAPADDSLPLYDAAQSAAWLKQEGDPAAVLLSRLTAADVSGALRTLPYYLREVAALYYVAELSYAELAEILNLPLGLVRSRLHRARREMERAMCARAREAGILPAA